jgi:TrmH family RNA methyltransferase
MRREITSLQNPLVKHLVKLRCNRDYRYEHHALVLEGSKPIKEVLHKVKTLIYSENFIPFNHSGAEEWVVTDAIMKKISGFSTPEGVVAEVPMPECSLLKDSRYLLVLDGINDPGNMGTMMRTALAFGWDGVYILPTSCDPFNEKVLRAARGAHFKLPIKIGTVQELQEMATKQGFQPLLADIRGTSPEKLVSKSKCMLIMGNEAHGASDAVREFSIPVAIPMPGQMESLNVSIAGGILLYLLKDRKKDE